MIKEELNTFGKRHKSKVSVVKILLRNQLEMNKWVDL